MKTTVSGDVFIIPNEIVLVEELLPSSKERALLKLKNFGIEADNKTALVQVWATGSKVDNWSCHGWIREFMADSELEDYYSGNLPELAIEQFPTYLPVKLFDGKCEGQKVTLHTVPEGKLTNGLVINLTLSQLNHRYSNFGRFEDLLNRLMRIHS